MLTDAVGRRPPWPNRSWEPLTRVARSGSVPAVERQKSRTVSRNFPFHSLHQAQLDRIRHAAEQRKRRALPS
jgi:hypothetical protein